MIEKPKEMFLAGDIDKSNKFSPEDMLNDLRIYVENNELKADDIPNLSHIKSCITRFNQYHKTRRQKR